MRISRARRVHRSITRPAHQSRDRRPATTTLVVIALALIAAVQVGGFAQTDGSQPGATAPPSAGADGAGADEVFAPFVSRLRLSILDPQVRVSWEDSQDITTTYRVYRSTEPITNATFDDATLIADVAPGEEAYLDIPDTPGDYYYAVVAETAAGQPYRIIIPGRNASFLPVAIANVATEAERAARIRDMDAAVVSAQGQTAIEVTVVADREGRDIAIYRSTQPVTTLADLEEATLVRELPSDAARLVDLPVPGVGYFYAAVDADLLIAGGAEIVPGENATVAPAEIPLAVAADSPGEGDALPEATASATVTPPLTEPLEMPAATATRGVPLPFLQLQNALATGQRLGDPRILIPDRTELSAGTDERVAAFVDELGKRAIGEPSVSILPVDRLPNPEGAEYTLRTILDGPFGRMAWESALEQLANYFTLPLTPELAARAHFYRAQIYYFLGDEQRAILEFLLARDRYYAPVEEWLGRILGDTGA